MYIEFYFLTMRLNSEMNLKYLLESIISFVPWVQKRELLDFAFHAVLISVAIVFVKFSEIIHYIIHM